MQERRDDRHPLFLLWRLLSDSCSDVRQRSPNDERVRRWAATLAAMRASSSVKDDENYRRTSVTPENRAQLNAYRNYTSCYSARANANARMRVLVVEGVSSAVKPREADHIFRHMEGYLDLRMRTDAYSGGTTRIDALFRDDASSRKAASLLEGYVMDRKRPGSAAGVIRVVEINARVSDIFWV